MAVPRTDGRTQGASTLCNSKLIMLLVHTVQNEQKHTLGASLQCTLQFVPFEFGTPRCRMDIDAFVHELISLLDVWTSIIGSLGWSWDVPPTYWIGRGNMFLVLPTSDCANYRLCVVLWGVLQFKRNKSILFSVIGVLKAGSVRLVNCVGCVHFYDNRQNEKKKTNLLSQEITSVAK